MLIAAAAVAVPSAAWAISAGCQAVNAGALNSTGSGATQRNVEISGPQFAAGDVLNLTFTTTGDNSSQTLNLQLGFILQAQKPGPQNGDTLSLTAGGGETFARGSIISGGGSGTNTITVTCTPGPAPTVTSVSPNSGVPAGGTSVTITGTGFTDVTAVRFGATNATSFTVNSSTSITAVSPAGTGTVDITVTTPADTSATGANDRFTYAAASSSVALASSANPSTFGQSVTFVATVTGSSPTGTVTFRDGATVLGTSPLGAGQATFTMSTLSVGSHSITAAYSGDANNAASTSAALNQVVGVPADSAKLRALQIAATKLIAQGSGQAITGAVDSAIADGFAEGGAPFTMSPSGMRFNFAAETERMDDAFAALGYDKIVRKAPVYVKPEKIWLPWLEIRGTGFDVDTTRNGIRTDITGTQMNAIAGLTRKLTSDLLLGAFAGYETFNYTSETLNGRLKGDGWTVGGYLGWRLMPGLRFDATVARSGVSYDGTAGTAAATFPGTRWLASGGLTGTHKAAGFEIEPSLKAYALWEHESAYVDTLGTAQAERNFTTGRASGGVKVAYPLAWGAGWTVAPYAGLYADYYFSKDDAATTALLLPAEVLHGWSARVTSGIAMKAQSGAMLSVGGELGGLGSDFTMWTLKGRASVPF